jgi:diguanylate cyclase (GGDEF)-like protein
MLLKGDRYNPAQDGKYADAMYMLLDTIAKTEDTETRNQLIQIARSTFRQYDNAQEEKITELEKKAGFDQLTGLPNRHKIQEKLQEEFRRASRDMQPRTIALIDIDFFKKVNDTYGHNAGDDVLRTIAQYFSDNTRNSDYFGRWGGEEFMLIFPEGKKEGIEKHLNRLRKGIKEITTHTTCGNDITVTTSYGAAYMQDVPEAIALMQPEGRSQLVQALYDSSYTNEQKELAECVYTAATRYAQELARNQELTSANRTQIDIILDPTTALDIAIELVIKRADDSLYKAKEEGRDKVVMYDKKNPILNC